MNLIDAAKLGMGELVRMARNGTLKGRTIWLAARGAATYYNAILTGDIATEEEQDRRALTCATCEHLTARVLETGQEVGYCGEPFNESPVGTCGCLVTITVDGEYTAAGRGIVRSLKCPLPDPRW